MFVRDVVETTVRKTDILRIVRIIVLVFIKFKGNMMNNKPLARIPFWKHEYELHKARKKQRRLMIGLVSSLIVNVIVIARCLF